MDNEYTIQQALELLMMKIKERNPDLYTQIQSAIDAGKDIEEREPPVNRRHNPRVYRKTVRLTDAEAFQVVLGALRTCLIDLPLFVNSAGKDFRGAAIVNAVDQTRHRVANRYLRMPDHFEGVDSPKVLEIEFQTETRIFASLLETIRIDPIPDTLVEQQDGLLRRLSELVACREE